MATIMLRVLSAPRLNRVSQKLREPVQPEISVTRNPHFVISITPVHFLITPPDGRMITHCRVISAGWAMNLQINILLLPIYVATDRRSLLPTGDGVLFLRYRPDGEFQKKIFSRRWPIKFPTLRSGQAGDN